MVNLDFYKVFYTVAKCKSLTKAAEELYITQPAVSHAIKQLEAQLGTTLFHRKQKSMELTAQGGALIFENVKTALELLEDAENKLDEAKRIPTGTLRIGASETIFQYALSSKIMEFRDLYPQVKIELVSDVSPKIIEALKTDKCDVGFLNLPIEPDNGVTITDMIMFLNDVFIVGKRYSFLAEKTLTLADLQNYPLVLLDSHTVARESFERYAADCGEKFSPAVEVASWGYLKQLVAEGLGIGCVPQEYIQNEVADGALIKLDVAPAMPVRSVGLALPKNSIMPYSLRLFIDLFKKSAG